ncbi:MAG: tail fiber domain-containing protein [Magnetococcales bacterium]|nr:tail fiber domain-containing protein [Magnetococcales bacterium]
MYWGLLAAKGDPGAAVVSGMAPGGVIFGASGGGAEQNAANLFWNDTNKCLGIGTSTPSNTLSIRNSGSVPTEAIQANASALAHGSNFTLQSLATLTDGNVGTLAYIMHQLLPGYIGLAFPEARTLTSFRVHNIFNNDNALGARHVILQRYDNGNWTKIPITGWEGATQYNTDEAEFTQPTGWITLSFSPVTDTQIRIKVISIWNGATDKLFAASDIQVYAEQVGVTSVLLDVTSSGSVGLNASNPQAKLDINHTGAGPAVRVYRATSTTTDPVLTVYSDVGDTNTNVFSIMANGSYGTISDPKLKSTTENATSKLDDLMRLRIVNFRFKGDQFHKNIGVLASEFREVFPSLVRSVPDTMTIPDPDYILKEGETESDRPVIVRKTGTFTDFVVTSPMIWILVKSLQEEVAQRKALEARVAALEARQ